MNDNADTRPKNQAVPLSSVNPGTSVKLVKIDGGHSILHRLAEMGLTPGMTFTVMRSGRLGPSVIQLRGGRLVIGRGMVDRVMVRPLASAESDGN